MLHRQVYAVLAVLLAVLIASVAGSPTPQQSPKDHYPLAWVEIPYKNVIDNERLFQRYKKCVLDEHPTGCPQIVMDMIRLAPEAISTQCAKCLPAHIDRMKEIANYLCATRKADFDEIRRVRDPDRTIQNGFEQRFGKIDC